MTRRDAAHGRRAGTGSTEAGTAATGAAGLAHDLNNVVAAILAASDDILARTDLDRRTAADVGEIRRNAARGAALIRGFLDPAEPTAARVVVLDDIVADLAALIRRVVGRRVTLDIVTAVSGQLVRIDPTQFERILTNLAANARDAMPDGGTLALRLGQTAVGGGVGAVDEAVPAGPYATVEMADTGTGIEADLLPRIFAPFVTTKQATGGIGLGLATAREIADDAGGFLTVESTVGRGTSVVLHLPLCRGGAAAVEAGFRTVLLVDDEDMVRRVAERSLRRDGWDVVSADSAEAALGELGGTPVGLLIADVVLPGADGLHLLAAARRGHPGLPAILVSGYADERSRAECAALGAVFLSKPYTMRSLLDLARTLVPFR